MNAAIITLEGTRPRRRNGASRRLPADLGLGADGQVEPDADLPGKPVRADGAEQPALDIVDARAVAGVDRIDFDWLKDHVRRAAFLIEKSVSRISVQLLDAAEMAALHQRTFGDAIVTDVITFDSSTNSTNSLNSSVEADIAVCVDVARRESESRRHGVERELLLYILHGLLHCCGFDDRDEAGFQVMHAEEDRILAAIGVGATFDAGREY